MKKTISVFVAGEPKPQPRPKAFARNGRAGVYDPGTAKEWKNAIRHRLAKYTLAAIDGPLRVTLEFLLPRPKSHYGTGRNSKQLKESAPRNHTQRPDVDNLAKAVLDALSLGCGMGLWRDDTQVVELVARKAWADMTPPGMFLMIEPIHEAGKEGEA